MSFITPLLTLNCFRIQPFYKNLWDLVIQHLSQNSSCGNTLGVDFCICTALYMYWTFFNLSKLTAVIPTVNTSFRSTALNVFYWLELTESKKPQNSTHQVITFFIIYHHNLQLFFQLFGVNNKNMVMIKFIEIHQQKFGINMQTHTNFKIEICVINEVLTYISKLLRHIRQIGFNVQVAEKLQNS